MELLHGGLQRLVGEHSGAVAAALDEMLARDHRITQQLLDRVFQRLLHHAVDDEAVLRRIDVGNARMQDGEVQRVRRDRAVEHLQRRARVLGARLALGIGQDAHDARFEARRRLQHRRDVARHRSIRDLLSGSAAALVRGGAGAHGAGEYDAAGQQRAAVQKAIAGDRFERRAPGLRFLMVHSRRAASIDAVACLIVGAGGTSPARMLRHSGGVVKGATALSSSAKRSNRCRGVRTAGLLRRHAPSQMTRGGVQAFSRGNSAIALPRSIAARSASDISSSLQMLDAAGDLDERIVGAEQDVATAAP